MCKTQTNIKLTHTHSLSQKFPFSSQRRRIRSKLISDPAIKLFGKTIPLPELGVDSSSRCTGVLAGNQDSGDDCGLRSGESECENKEDTANEFQEKLGEESSRHESSNVTTTSGITDRKEVMKVAKTNEESSQNEAGGTACSQELKLKKPDKILPCPQCNSMETKFCYYNNYNVNQPRQFCKKCQRYWTASGTMRNVPVGAGRRKNRFEIKNHIELSRGRTGIQMKMHIPRFSPLNVNNSSGSYNH